MMVALVVLIVMTLAGIGLMRSMDTSNLIAGNLAFKQAATHSADSGIEAAVAWLEANNVSDGLYEHKPEVGYTASSGNNSGLATGEKFWDALKISGVCHLPMTAGACAATPGLPNDAGNLVSFMIQRLCNGTGDPNGAGCAVVAGSVASYGNNEEAGQPTLTGNSTGRYYRITVRVQGPRNAVSYVQAIVSM